MKWIAILLLLANVGYFGMQMNQRIDHLAASTASDRDQKTEAAGSTLSLLSELDELPPVREMPDIEFDEEAIVEPEPEPISEPEPALAETESAKEPETPAEEVKEDVSGVPLENIVVETVERSTVDEGMCISIGSFATDEDRKTIKKWLATREMPTRERDEEIRTRERYWVYLQPTESDEKAREQLDELKRKGVDDYYMIQKGNMKNAISLGLFSSQDTVNRRLQELAKQGYHPVVIPQHKTRNEYWLDSQILQSLKLPLLPEGVEITNRDCSEIALLDAAQ